MLESIFTWDLDILRFLMTFQASALWMGTMEFFSHLNDKGLIWIVVSLLLIAQKKHRNTGVLMLMALATVTLLGEGMIKPTLMRERPFVVYKDLFSPIQQTGFAMPSGHTASSFAVLGVLLLRQAPKPLTLVVAVIAGLVSFSRMALMVHYPSDIFAGILLGLVVALGLVKIAQGTLRGLLVCLLIALPAWLLGKGIPIVGGPVFGITLGIVIGHLLERFKIATFTDQMQDGIQFTSKKILQYAIILLGFEMNFGRVLAVGSASLAIMIFTLSAALMTAYVMGRFLKVDSQTTILVGVGTAICGGSAIAATAPVIEADDSAVTQAISTIFLFNIAAVFIFPLLGRLLGMTDIDFGLWAGTAINDTSSVVAAGTAWSNAVGNNVALNYATVVKLTRTLMIVPITLTLALWRSQGKKVQVSRVFPWFVLGFIGAAIVNTLFPIPALSKILVQLGKFAIIMAMSAIGLKTNFRNLLRSGLRPIALGLTCWFAVASVALLFI